MHTFSVNLVDFVATIMKTGIDMPSSAYAFDSTS